MKIISSFSFYLRVSFRLDSNYYPGGEINEPERESFLKFKFQSCLNYNTKSYSSIPIHTNQGFTDEKLRKPYSGFIHLTVELTGLGPSVVGCGWRTFDVRLLTNVLTHFVSDFSLFFC